MMERLKEISGALAQVLPDSLELHTDDLQLIDDLLMMLAPVTQLTTVIQGAKYTTISDVALLWRSLQTQLRNMRVASAEEKKEPYTRGRQLFRTAHGAAIRDRLLFSLTHRGIMHTIGLHAVLAALLDARYRVAAFDLQNEWLFPIATQRNAIAELRRLESELSGAVPPAPAAAVAVAVPEHKDEKDGSLMRLRRPQAAAAPAPAAAAAVVGTEVDRYILLPDSYPNGSDEVATVALDWWRVNESKFPLLSRIAKRYIAIPASSAEPERVWSAAKLICGDLRGRLLNKTFVDHLLIHRNKDLLLDSD